MLEKKMGIDPEERHEEDALAVAEDVYITGVRLRNPTTVQVMQQPPLCTPRKVKQSTLSFTVAKTTVKIEKVPKLASSSQRVRKTFLINCSDPDCLSNER
jgi:hypothetical protein